MTKSLALPISGLNCASCSARAERALNATPGVTQASVNLATKTAHIRFQTPASPQSLVETLEQAGYPAALKQARLGISSMSCASCSGRVAQNLSDAPGVVEAQVNLATESATVAFIPGLTSPTELAQRVTDRGYPAQVLRADSPSAPSDKSDEIADLGRLTLIAALLTLPVFVVEMGGHIFPAFHHWVAHNIGTQTSRVLQFLLTSAVLFGPGWRFYRTGIPQLLKGTPEMNSLVALGTAAAYGYSTLATFAPALLPAAANHVYFEAAAVIVVLILLGRWLEARAKGRTGAAIAKLVGLRATSALVLRGDQSTEIPVEEIVTGDIIQLRPGEKIATDGEVITGSSFVDEAMVTGEPIPVQKQQGDALIGGTINGTGALQFRATKVGADTMLAQIIAMVEQAQGAKLPIQNLVDRITLWFVPAVILAAVITVLVWLAFGPTPVLSHALVAGVAVLIIACPCAMGLAVPTSIMVGTGRAAELGVLFRKGDALQELQDCAVIAFDKTGTLTQGRPELSDIQTLPGFDADQVLAWAASVEALSEHPIALAVTRAAETRGLTVPAAQGFASETGFGVTADVDGHQIKLGAARFFTRDGIDLTGLQPRAEEQAQAGHTPLFVAVDGQLAALITVADPIKPGAVEAIRQLKVMGLQLAMISGDAKATAITIARDLGIDHVEAELLPDGKTAAIERLKQKGKLAFIGDGINDAPALAAADVGLAIGTGTDIAIEAADVVLVSGDLGGVVSALDLSRRTLANIRQNLFWAFGYNTVLIPVAAGALYPLWGLQLSPMLGAGAMALSSVFVLSNALRLRFVSAAKPVAQPTPPLTSPQERPA
ncbi:Copper-transporting P-type ATPase [Pelagimonas phthalicica]|uniref:Copper-transporting P-type ATPase n=1 Tax=Pelagimonas phthalicica TaxID=1037362 RepID=A0A238JHH3_9RHOB|nr:heavy metal translocating P-type ATPase [Pelagimonas phthalicica]TDS89942.1 Cu+-exporting ATPase [Pelagimonas phthalicica]SMX30109.1 Copper-transporting P-type ATPase [Pelagimonas phthalicica]